MKLRYWLFILIATGLVFELHGRSIVQQQWNFDKAQLAQQVKDALQQRHDENAVLAVQQIAINNTIQKAHDEEIHKVNTALARSERLRISSHFCPEVARQTNAESTISSDGDDTTGRLLSAEVDSAVKQLMLESEHAAATGRAAQAFIRDNGLAE